MGVSLERAGEILALKFNKEEIKMGYPVSGVIKRKSVNATAWGNKVAFMVGNRWYSCLDKNIGDIHVKDLLMSLKEGDEVELDIVDNVSKKDGKTYANIVGAVRVDRIDKDGGKLPPVDKAGRDYSAESDKKDRGVALRFAVDMYIAGKIEMADIYDQANYFLAYIKGQPGD